MLDIIASNQFKKDLKLARKRGLKLDHLSNVVNTLARQEKLADKYRDHTLSGNYQGFRECHIEPDWLLVYRIDGDALELFLFRTGTHADLFLYCFSTNYYEQSFFRMAVFIFYLLISNFQYKKGNSSAMKLDFAALRLFRC